MSAHLQPSSSYSEIGGRMAKETAELLRKARALIDTPDKWIKGAMRITHPDGRTCRCAAGAVSEVCTPDVPYRVEVRVFDALARVSDGKRIFVINDAPETTHADVMAVFDKAISAEEADGER